MKNEKAYAVVCENVWKIFRSGAGIVKALKGVSIVLGAGEMVCLRGPSGSGKSTILNIVGALIRDRRSAFCFRSFI